MRKHRMIIASIVCSLAASLVLLAIASPAHAQQCQRTVTASVVALDQPFLWNRLGAAQPQGMIFALERDVVPGSHLMRPRDNLWESALQAGNVALQRDKRPRPLVLRANVGDCLQINFTNLLNTSDLMPFNAQAQAGVHVMGLELVGSIASDASWVGQNPNSYASPGDTKTYTYYAGAEGTFLLSSVDDQTALQNGVLVL